MALFLTDNVKQMSHTGVSLICVPGCGGKKGRGSFISCHGKLTVYLKEFTHYHLKSNTGSLSAKIKQDNSKKSVSLPWSHPHIYFQDLGKKLSSVGKSTRKHN